MIVGSLLLILVAVGLLVGGVVGGSNALIVCCIVAAVLAAVVLVIGVKQSAGDGADPADAEEDEATEARETRARGRSEATSRGRESGRRSAVGASSYGSGERTGTLVEERTSIPTQTPFTDESPTERRPTERVNVGARTETFERYREEPPPPAAEAEPDYEDDDPPDEPSAQMVSPQQAARVAMLSADVLVVDGRPRYHVTGCVHLLGRESEPIPVGEAVELGFSPCGLCEPDSKLLADARRV